MAEPALWAGGRQCVLPPPSPAFFDSICLIHVRRGFVRLGRNASLTAVAFPNWAAVAGCLAPEDLGPLIFANKTYFRAMDWLIKKLAEGALEPREEAGLISPRDMRILARLRAPA